MVANDYFYFWLIHQYTVLTQDKVYSSTMNILGNLATS